MRPVALAGILASTTILSGCAGTTVAGLSLSSISSYAGFASTLFTGADLGEHAVSLVTGKDCRFSEGLMRDDRDVCEDPGSPATRNDFHGIFVERIDEDGTVIFAAPKYMPASVGAGENENNPDIIWAEIKAQKATEEAERQLSRANASQSIDVASLAAGSLSAESLAFLPASTKAVTEIADAGDTASQTATRPRQVVNAAAPKPAAQPKDTSEAQPDIALDEPAIEEATLTGSLKAAKENGQGGPLFSAAPSTETVVSKLVNGQPVVVLRLAPIFAGLSGQRDTATASVSPNFTAPDAGSTVVALPSARPAAPAPSTAPSPLAVLQQAKTAPAAPITVAAIEPQMTESRPRTKPRAAEILAEPEKPKAQPAAVRPAPRKREAVLASVADADVYQPPARDDIADSPAPDLMGAAPVQMPGDIPAAPMQAPASMPPAALTPAATESGSSEPAPAAEPPATSNPAPLVPIAQP